MAEESFTVLLIFVVILVLIIVGLVWILRPANVKRCMYGDKIEPSQKVAKSSDGKTTSWRKCTNKKKERLEKYLVLIIVLSLLAAFIIFMAILFFSYKGVRQRMTSFAKKVYRVSVKIYKVVSAYLKDLGGSVPNLPEGLKALYLYVLLFGCLIVTVLYGVLFGKKIVGDKVLGLAGESKFVQGWLLAGIITCILIVILVFIIMMGYLEKNSKSQKLAIKANIILVCFLITCVTIVIEGRHVEEEYKEDNTYYDKYYLDGKKDPSFIVHACLSLFGVLMIFVALYSFAVHNFIVKDCDRLYDDEAWTMYVNGNLDGVKLDIEGIHKRCISKQNNIDAKNRKIQENEEKRKMKEEAKQAEKLQEK
jgi:hypothetical protein